MGQHDIILNPDNPRGDLFEGWDYLTEIILDVGAFTRGTYSKEGLNQIISVVISI